MLVTGCTWVKLDPAARNIRVIEPGQAAACKKIGVTRVSLLDKVMGMRRSREKVQEELNTLARNSALDLGGNAVMADSPVEDGRQVFVVFECPPA